MLDRVSWATPDREVLSDISLNVAGGESVAIMGPSGSGKTSILSLCLALIRPTRGTITVDGQVTNGLSGRRLASLRARSIGMVYQFGELLPELTALDNIALPSMWSGTGRTVARDAARDLMEQLSIDHLAHSVSADLSGGERQRVAVARALINRPALVLADEPTGSVDEEAADTVCDLLFSLPHEQRCSLVVCTHDRSVARRADRTLRLDAGRLHDVA